MELVTIVHFAVATVLPAITAAFLTSISRDRITEMGYWRWQIICGVVFGLIAVTGTEIGIVTNDATMNVRDAAPITAGLFFGGPAGIIAGIIGGVERWFAALWGRGMFTRVACSVATILAGFYAALLRKQVFEDRMPSWPLAAATGLVAEVLHLLLVFMTNMDNAERAFVVVRACSIPMITCNAIAVALVALVLGFMAGELPRKRSEAPDISHVMQTHLLSVIVLGFLASALFTTALQQGLADAETHSLLTLSLDDAKTDISEASDHNLLMLTRQAAQTIPRPSSATQEKVDALVDELDVTEIDVIDSDGIIVASNFPEFVGFDMASGEQSAEFLDLLPGGGRTQLVQEFQSMAYDQSVKRKYAGVRIEGGILQVGYGADEFVDDLEDHVRDAVRNRHVGREGALVVLAPDGTVAGSRSDMDPSVPDMQALAAAADGVPEGSVFSCEFLGVPCFAAASDVDGYRLFALQPVSEVELGRDVAVLVMAYMEVIVFAMLFVAAFLLIRNEVVRSIWKVNGTLDRITRGDLEAEVTVKNNAEFISLSRDINAMVASLRTAIEEEGARIDRELEYARAIQESALPRIFPPFPEIGAFDIYASMNAAREVGGDFYDFFLIDEHTLGFLIADVSGKGIPASLFMMAAKAELASYMMAGMPLSDAVQTANWQLCQGNDAGMFVTVWAATLDYETGELIYVNAGHNPPLLRRDGTWEWLRSKGGPFLGAFDSASFHSDTLTLARGDELFLYTDGVNEAFSAEGEQYGDARVEQFLDEHARLHPRPLIDAMRSELARWEKGVDQSDDITMLALEFGVSPQATESLTVPATVDRLEEVLDFIHEALRDRSCPLSTQNQLDIVIEELFVNVCHYAYEGQDEPGSCTLTYIYNANPSALTVSIVDSGIPFDPLAHADPVTPDSIDDAKIGGLGILMAKRMTDDMSYVRDDDKNVLAFVKSW